MLTKKRADQSKVIARDHSSRARKIWAKMTRTAPVSSYSRMDSPAKKGKSDNMEECFKTGRDKENKKVPSNKEAKEKKPKKKGWKRLRQVALTSCRYIGMGVSHMSAASTYPAGDYQIDPKNWNKSFGGYHTTHVTSQTPNWTSGMMFSGW